MRSNRNITLMIPRGVLLFAMIMLCMCVLVPSADAQAKWVKKGQKYRYTTNASGSKYYKNRWAKIKGKYYYFDKKGYRKTGWLQYGGKKYYLNKKGIRMTGFLTIKNKKYYFNKKGVMLTGWVKYNNCYYYMNSNGEVQTGLQCIEDNMYFFDNMGKRVSGANIVIGGLPYYFANNGTLQYTGTDIEQAAKYINVQRLLQGYEPLTFYNASNANLSLAAVKRAKELAISSSHIRPDGTNYSTVMTKDYPVYTYWSGECILWGKEKSGVTVASSWMSNQNASILLQKEANAFSIANYTDERGCQYWVAIVTQMDYSREPYIK